MLMILAQEAAAAPGGGGLFGAFVPMLLVFAVFYFLLIRPQQKQQKKLKAMVEAMRQGDEVITRSGIHGRVTSLEDSVIMVEIANNVKVKMNRDQVALVKTAATA